jgi:hypothetical protein
VRSIFYIVSIAVFAVVFLALVGVI